MIKIFQDMKDLKITLYYTISLLLFVNKLIYGQLSPILVYTVSKVQINKKTSGYGNNYLHKVSEIVRF